MRAALRWFRWLPEEAVDHVLHFARIDIDQHRVVIIPDPAIRTIDLRQAIVAWVADLIALTEEQVLEEKPDRQAAIAIIAVRRIVRAEPVIRLVRVAIAVPVVLIVAAPARIPLAVIAIAVAPIVARLVVPGIVARVIARVIAVISAIIDAAADVAAAAIAIPFVLAIMFTVVAVGMFTAALAPVAALLTSLRPIAPAFAARLLVAITVVAVTPLPAIPAG